MKKVLSLTLLFLCLHGYAQQATQAPALFGLFSHLKLELAEVKKAAPHFPVNYTDGKFENSLAGWLDKYPAEWKAVQQLPPISAQGINWESYGIPAKYASVPQVFEDSYWQWVNASGISKERMNALFPHFPVPVSLENTPANLQEYAGRVGTWMRLYPKEYNAFLNAPELAKLAPERKDKVVINYIPKFLGARVGSTFPVKKNTGNKIMDDFTYELAVRHWYYLYEPVQFEALYGKDYDFPADFNPEYYRQRTLAKIVSIERGDQSEDDYKSEAIQVKPTWGTMDWNSETK